MPAVLGIDVEPALLKSWSSWLAPDPQPFLVGSADSWRECDDEGGVMTPELEDTYRLWWGVEKGSSVIWISEGQFGQLPKRMRAALVREQAGRRRGAVPTVRGWQDLLDAARLRSVGDGHRFVWWPSLLVGRTAQIVSRVVSAGERRAGTVTLMTEHGMRWGRCCRTRSVSQGPSRLGATRTASALSWKRLVPHLQRRTTMLSRSRHGSHRSAIGAATRTDLGLCWCGVAGGLPRLRLTSQL